MEWMKLFLKGIAIGICDLIPGISGGTMALLVGVYERLINAINNFNLKNLSILLSNLFNIKKLNNNMKKFDFYFLFPLMFGVLFSIILGASVVSYLLENFFTLLMSFFIGLILSSSFLLFRQINVKGELPYLLLGLFFGSILFFISPLKVEDPSFFYILFSGFIAIFALFLPGISGATILLILGMYEFIINSIKNLFESISTLVVFGIGAIFGVFVISRLVKFLFKLNKNRTLTFLLGLVFGSLLVPFNLLVSNTSNFINIQEIFVMLVFTMAGFGFPLLLTILSRK